MLTTLNPDISSNQNLKEKSMRCENGIRLLDVISKDNLSKGSFCGILITKMVTTSIDPSCLFQRENSIIDFPFKFTTYNLLNTKLLVVPPSESIENMPLAPRYPFFEHSGSCLHLLRAFTDIIVASNACFAKGVGASLNLEK